MAEATTMFVERREEPRQAMSLPLRLEDGSLGMTANISPHGMFVQVPGPFDLTGLVFFEMCPGNARLNFTAQGRIVRVVTMNQKTGIAIALRSPLLKSFL